MKPRSSKEELIVIRCYVYMYIYCKHDKWVQNGWSPFDNRKTHMSLVGHES